MIQDNGAAQHHTDSFRTNSGEVIICSVHYSFQEIAYLQAQWDTFVETANGDIYLTFDWCRIWWAFYGANRHLRIYLFYADDSLVGIIPMFYEQQWIGPVRLKIAKLVSSDSTICMVNPPVRTAFAASIFRCVIESLIKTESCDAIWFGPIGGKYDSLRFIRSTIHGYSAATLFHDKVLSPYTTFTLPKTFEEYIQSLDKRQRGNLRRDLNLINKSFQIRQDVIQDESNARSEFGNVVQMHTTQWNAENKLGHFDDWPHGAEFNTRMVVEQAKLGRLRLIRLLADGRAASYQLCYAFGNRWYWRLPARAVGPDWDKYALGRIGLIKEIEMAITEGVQEIEAGAGHYEYKVKLGGDEYPLYSLLLVRNQLFCRWRVFLFTKSSALLNVCYYRVWFQCLAPRLPFKRRPLWKLWIRTQL